MKNQEGQNKKPVEKGMVKKRRKKKNPILPILLGFLIIIGGMVGARTLLMSKPVFKIIQGWDGNGIRITMEAEAVPLKYAPIEKDGELVFPIEFIKDYIDDTIFWDEAADKLTITNAEKVIRMSTDDLNYFVNNEPLTLDMPVYKIEDKVYMPESMMKELYHVSNYFNKEKQIVSLDFDTKAKVTATLTKRTKVTYEAGKKSEVLLILDKKELVTVFEEKGDYTKIRTAEGIPGYILTKNIGERKTEKPIELEETNVKEPWQPKNGKINMVWDQVFKAGQSGNESKKVPIDGLDVISPTWFSIADNTGEISNIADRSFVDWAHSQGYQVWALFSNGFDSKLTHDTLSDTNIREKMIKQILAFASLYDLDGINIDFESLAGEDGEYYVQFIREITPLLKQQGLTVSVDMYIPSPWTRHYDMEAVGKIVDYVCIMAYDEHHATASESGSVASIGWVDQAMADAIKMVAPEKIIMGMPVYTRLWEEKTIDGTTEVSSQALGMKRAQEVLAENQVTAWFDKESGQNYGEYEKDGNRYRLWLEDKTSIESRLKIVEKYQVGGIAVWKRGLETEDVWPLIKSYLKK